MRATPVAIAIAILLAPQAASAGPKPRERAAVVAIDLGAGAPAYLRTAAAHQIEVGLAAAGYEVVPAAQVSGRLTGELARCREGACMRRAGEALGVRSLVTVTIDSKDENTVVTMRLHDGITGQREAEVREVCDLCGQAELSERLGIAASALRARAIEAREREAKQSPARPATTGPATAAEPRSLGPGILVGAAGAIAVGAGIYLLAIDGRGTCQPGDQPVYPDPGAVIRYPDPSNPDVYVCRERYETKLVGIATAGAGVAAIAAGVALVIRARHRGRAVEIAPRAGGATVQVSWPW